MENEKRIFFGMRDKLTEKPDDASASSGLLAYSLTPCTRKCSNPPVPKPIRDHKGGHSNDRR